MTVSWRTSALAERHRALGSVLEDWNGMGTAWTHATDLQQDYVTIRTRAGLMDVSGLKKLHAVGPHASAIVDSMTTRNVEKITPGRAAYAAMLNESGKFIDDWILYRTGPTAWLVVHGSGAAHETLAAAVVGRNAALLFDDDVHDLSLQCPVAVEFPAHHVRGIRQLPYFHHVATTLFGASVMISRIGYTGERGYEIFCRRQDAAMIWDTILREDRDLGIRRTAFSPLDLLRVESYLLFYPYDNSETFAFADAPPGDTLWELGLDFTVSPGKTGFRGAAAHYQSKGRERFRIFRVLLDGMEAASSGAGVFAGDSLVGVVTNDMGSSLTDRSMGIARLAPPAAAQGTKLKVAIGDRMVPAIAHTLPFDDPEKKKRTALG